MTNDSSHAPAPNGRQAPEFPRWIVFGFLAILGGGLLMYLVLRPEAPLPPEVAGDPLLSQGRVIYVARCVACHGLEGKGDCPIANNLVGPPPGDLTDDEWKHGANPEQVIRVIGDGIPNTRMDGWARVLDPPDLRAIAGYVYHLGRRPIPQELRGN